MTDTLSILTNIGFSPLEAQIYLSLLNLGEATPSEISEDSGVKRTSVYTVLDRLVTDGAAHVTESGTHKTFSPTPPAELLADKARKLAESHAQVSTLEALIATLPSTPKLHLAPLNNATQAIQVELAAQNSLLLIWDAAMLELHTKQLDVLARIPDFRLIMTEQSPLLSKIPKDKVRFAPSELLVPLSTSIIDHHATIYMSPVADYALTLTDPAFTALQHSMFEALWAVAN